MITKDIAFAFRNIVRNKLLATINVLGLSIGVSACLIIFLIATYELGFDTFQPDRDRIYRIYSQFPGPYHQTNPGVPTALAVAVQEHFTGIESMTNFHTLSAKAMVRHKTSDTKDLGTHNKIIIASPDYFHVFDYYEWLVGNPEESLSKPYTVVLSESRARIYFGDGDLINVIGREVIYQDSLSVTVPGDLGFNPDAVVFLNTPGEGTKEQRSALRNELAQIPEIEAFGMHGAGPIANFSLSQDMTFNNGKEILKHKVYIKSGDTSYLRVYDIKLLAGSNFLPADSMRQLIINQTYLHMLGFADPKDAIGKATSEGTTIVGVARDFHTTSLHAAIRPTAISYATDQTGFGIKLFTPNKTVSDLKPGLSKIEAAWKLVYPDEIFRYSFMDDNIRRYYENEARTRKLAGIATVIALVISCLGLFGLCSFTVIQRTKEIGIRKVLGATVNGIIILLAKGFLILVAIALVLSTPFAYYMSRWWLEDFAYKIQLTVWLFGLTGMFSLIIALITISFRTVNAAKADPVKSLRYE